MSMGGSVQQPAQATATGTAAPAGGKGGAIPQTGMAASMPPAPTEQAAPQPTAMEQGFGTAVNPYTQASQGMQNAYDTVYGALNQNSQMTNPNFGTYQQHNLGAAPQASYTGATSQGYNTATSKAAGYDANTMNAALNKGNVTSNAPLAQTASMDAALNKGVPQAQQQMADADRYRAVTQDSPDAIRQQMNKYQNPYQQQVLDRTMAQMDKQRLQALDQNRASAAAAGAFGGSRHGVVDAITNSEINQSMGDMAANLNLQGFNTAAGLAGQDISNQMSVASQNQAAQNAARQFGSAAQNAASQFNASQGNQLNQFNAGNRFQNQINNQAALNNANQFNAGQSNQMNQFNAGNRTQNNQFNAGQRFAQQTNNQNAQNQANLANQAAMNQAGQFNAANQQQTNFANQNAYNTQRQFGANAANTASQFNAGQRNDMSQYNASNRFNQNLSNQAAINQARQFNAMQQGNNMNNMFNNAMQGAGALGNLANQSFGIGNAVAGNQINAGSMSQQQNQQLLDQAQQMYNNFISQPQNILQMRLASLGMNPMNNTGTTTQTTQPGWGQMFGNLLGAAGNAFQFSPIKWGG